MDVAMMTTEELQRLCRQDLESEEGLPWEDLTAVLDELTKRRSSSDPKVAEEAWRVFEEHYLPDSVELPPMPALDAFMAYMVGRLPAEEFIQITQEHGKEHWLIKPSWHGERCLSNGNFRDIECACDECDYYLECFPDWRETEHNPYHL